jgi:hypothetical protein
MNRTRAATYTGRFLLILASLALIGAWITQLTGGPILSMNQQHLFNDAIALALLGIANFLDALLHSKLGSHQ